MLKSYVRGELDLHIIIINNNNNNKLCDYFPDMLHKKIADDFRLKFGNINH